MTSNVVTLDLVTYDGTPATLPEKHYDGLLLIREVGAWDRDFPHFGFISAMYWVRPRRGDMWAYWTGPGPAPALLGKRLYAWREHKKLIPREVAEMSGGALTVERIKAIELGIGEHAAPTKEEYAALIALIWPEEKIAEPEGLKVNSLEECKA